MIFEKERVWTRVETGNQPTATGWTGNQYFAVWGFDIFYL